MIQYIMIFSANAKLFSLDCRVAALLAMKNRGFLNSPYIPPGTRPLFVERFPD
ncbi:MAG: hypothetical protein ACI4V3_06980 [Faecousia sp.]